MDSLYLNPLNYTIIEWNNIWQTNSECIKDLNPNDIEGWRKGRKNNDPKYHDHGEWIDLWYIAKESEYRNNKDEIDDFYDKFDNDWVGGFEEGYDIHDNDILQYK